jgi:hypothetical protein
MNKKILEFVKYLAKQEIGYRAELGGALNRIREDADLQVDYDSEFQTIKEMAILLDELRYITIELLDFFGSNERDIVNRMLLKSEKCRTEEQIEKLWKNPEILFKKC